MSTSSPWFAVDLWGARLRATLRPLRLGPLLDVAPSPADLLYAAADVAHHLGAPLPLPPDLIHCALAMHGERALSWEAVVWCAARSPSARASLAQAASRGVGPLRLVAPPAPPPDDAPPPPQLPSPYAYTPGAGAALLLLYGPVRREARAPTAKPGRGDIAAVLPGEALDGRASTLDAPALLRLARALCRALTGGEQAQAREANARDARRRFALRWAAHALATGADHSDHALHMTLLTPHPTLSGTWTARALAWLRASPAPSGARWTLEATARPGGRRRRLKLPASLNAPEGA